MNIYFLASTVTLIIQLVILVLLFWGFSLQRRKRFYQHGTLMAVAVVLHLILVLIVMIPSLVVITITISGFSTTIIALLAAHGVLGLTTLILGIWLTVTWRFRQTLQYCAPKKNVMLATFSTWTIVLILGAVLYFMLYFP